MKIIQDSPHLLTLSLSRKNLEGLIYQLDHTYEGDSSQIMRSDGEADKRIIVVAQEDAEHYNDRPAGVSDGSDVPWRR